MEELKIHYSGGTMNVKGCPDHCPFCHRSIKPVVVHGYARSRQEFDVYMHCPTQSCNRTFVAYYKYHSISGMTYSDLTSSGNLVGREFSAEISSVSKDFIHIYNQAYEAEQLDLDQICGVGYRKALEFLIKDYCIKKNPSNKEGVENLLLGKVIEQFVNDDKIKNVAKRAAWLGNDETHYIKKWEGKSLIDLKKLIDLTLHWIEAEILTESITEEMN